MFFELPPENFIKLQGEHNYSIVVLSIIIACVASFTALSMNKRAQKNSFFHQNFWLALASISMGFGIWSMHFIGMSAFHLPIEMSYDPLLTVISVLPAMIASFLAFYIPNRRRKNLWLNALAGVVMGLGISTMHYVGMVAMKMDALHVYDMTLFIASIVIAIIVSFVALYIFSSLHKHMENLFIQSMTAMVMGIAVSSMHYTGMFAVTFYVSPNFSSYVTDSYGAQMSFITVSVIIGMALLIALLFLSGLVDRYVKYQTKYYDSLTRLPNRRQFERKIASVSGEQTLAIWHLHDLEKVNRDNGYLFGDEVIWRVSEILIGFLPPMTDIYRIEGNRFAFLLENINEAEYFHESMEKIARRLSQPLVFEKKEIIIPAVCAWSEINEEENPTKIYSNVLDVLNHPSLQYKHEIILYNSAIHTYTFEREIASDIVRAMEKNELYLVYQPKINGKTYEVIGIETLLRWKHPTYGPLSPGVFIPILEKNGHMLDVTDWVIRQTCRQISDWRSKNISFEQVAINIPGEYVTSSRLLKVLKSTLTTYNLESHLLELEITETSFVKKIEEAIRAVSVFREEGFSVALDDFGTGVSSLSYLKKIPISTLKIDKSFVDEVPGSEKDSSIIQAIIALGSSLDLQIVFEGVETKEQAKFLVSTCERPIMQGYYFAKPMMVTDLVAWHQDFYQKQPLNG